MNPWSPRAFLKTMLIYLCIGVFGAAALTTAQVVFGGPSP